MLLSEKIELLRSLEGNLRGLSRSLRKSEVVRLIREELGESISEAYLSQLESGKRNHMTARTRELISRFFKVHPGFLVSDPEGFRTELAALPMVPEDRLDDWLRAGAGEIASTDAELADALRELADSKRTRSLIMAMARLARSPEALTKLITVLGVSGDPNRKPRQRRRKEEGP